MSATGPSAVVPAGSIPDLRFAVTGAGRLEYAAVPTLRFALRIESAEGQAIRSILLDAQIQIAARRRPYDARAHDRLFELFGPPEAWGTTLRTLQWTRTTLVVPPFTGETVVDLPVVCTYDLEVAAARYLDALADGDVPLEFLFSGTVFYAGPSGLLQTARIAWDREASYRLPVAVWRETMEHHFPGTAWLRLPKDGFDRLCAYKSRHALASWDDVVDRLLGSEAQER
jgi:Family of unknown function (DUF6084)